MKIILSRKGFDSKFGGYPSPIAPDGAMTSLPIPSSDFRQFSEVRATNGKTLFALMSELGFGQKLPGTTCHLDPDLDPNSIPRKAGWRPSLGQLGAAQTHLKEQMVGVGDLFLFFGWFRNTKLVKGRLEYLSGREQQFHAIFGYLQIGEILKTEPSGIVPDWLHDHPHVNSPRVQKAGNTIYIASDRLSFSPELPGGGKLGFTESNRLTKPGYPRSRWDLDPAIFKGAKITYHNEKSWKAGYFQSAAIGQEFVIHPNEAILNWASSLIRAGSAHP